MNDSDALWNLRLALRDDQDAGLLPYDQATGRRFQVLGGEVAVPVLRELVTLLCLEGLTAYLLVALDEAPPYVGVHIDDPDTTLWLYPSVTTAEVITRVRGGRFPYYQCDRVLPYRDLTSAALQSGFGEQLRLALCPTLPLI
ncbi:MAG: hypothetical protein JSR64_10455 [Nitrospira sp.]|nr:hypothetical protein [Nitrospira sp.]MCW5778530.1 hypothetical protein [Nitrospira sp.]